MSLLKKAGLTYYRLDLATNSDGTILPATADRFYHIIKIAADSGITLIPIVFLESSGTLYKLSADTAYEHGKTAGSGFARAYKQYFTYYELGNENDGEVLNQPAGDGDDIAHYDTAKLAILAAYLRGMSEGVRQEDSKAKIIVNNSGWKHYMYFDLLDKQGVKFDIIGYHWYQDLHSLRGVLRVLRSWFPDKRVWFTEFNSQGTLHEQTGSQVQQVRKEINAISRIGRNVDALFFYELLDEPAAPVTSTEAHYGLYNWDRRYDSVLAKPILGVIRKAQSDWIQH